MRFNKLFGIGLPRTGTTSLNIALNTLGIPSVHFPFSLYENNDRTILDQYTAFIDTPIPLLYQELDQLCPNSGFILTTRAVEDWLNSMEWLLTEGRKIWQWKASYDTYNQDFFGSSEFVWEQYENKYDQFHEEVYQYFQNRSNLLILDLNTQYGYQDVCEFLEIPIYRAKYPRGNESREASVLQRLAYQVRGKNSSLEYMLRRLDHYVTRTQQKLTNL